MLNNTFPLFVPLVALCLYRTKTSYKVWLGIIVGFIGIGLVLNPTPQFFKPVALIGLLSGALAAVSVVIIRSLTKTTPILQILFYNFLICSLLSGLFLPFGWQEISLKTLGLLVLLGLFGALYQVCSTLSFAKAPVRLTSPLMFLSLG